MKERPIIFSAEMVRAILDGRKTMTRRVIKDVSSIYNDHPSNVIDNSWSFNLASGGCQNYSPPRTYIKCPYGHSGSKLWVKETWADALNFGFYTGKYFYRASYINGGPYDDVKKWRPSIYMPRCASRITLEITAIRVERLQDISDGDVLREGVTREMMFSGMFPKPPGAPLVARFKYLWDSLNAERSYGWDTNPYVWVIAFKRI